MNDPSPTCSPQTLPDTTACISSLASPAGTMPSTSQAGEIIPCGPEAAPASRSAQRGSGKGQRTKDTSGLSSCGSSASAARRSSSVSKSHPQKLSALSLRLISLSRFSAAASPEPTNSPSDSLPVHLSPGLSAGSMEYSQTWREKITPSGLRYWEHTARARRTSDSDCSGWPSPKAQEDGRTLEQYEAGRQRGYERRKGKTNGGPASAQGGLSIAAQLAGWPSPMAGSPATETYNEAGRTDSSRKTVALVGWGSPRASEIGRQRSEEAIARARENGGSVSLEDQVQLTGWATPASRDWRDGKASEATMQRNSRPLNEQAVMLASGPTSTSFPVETKKPGVLNPAHSLWLMGFPSDWLMAAPVKESRGRRRCGV